MSDQPVVTPFANQPITGALGATGAVGVVMQTAGAPNAATPGGSVLCTPLNQVQLRTAQPTYATTGGYTNPPPTWPY
jgi:hypothetical protein